MCIVCVTSIELLGKVRKVFAYVVVIVCEEHPSI